jgi:Holliday junction resolvase RusA-like endonuclease
MPREANPELLGELNVPDFDFHNRGDFEPKLDIPPLEVKVVEFTIQGEPKSGSQLKFNRKTGNAYRPKEHKIRMQDVYDAACSYIPEGQRPYFRKGTPIILGVRFYFPYRSTDYGTGKNIGVLKPNAPTFCIGQKDIDNMLKPLKDGMKGVVYNDDKQIVAYSECWKLYSESPRTVVTIKEVS